VPDTHRQCAGHHRLTFEGAKLALGKPAEHLADYFDACRRKRNEIDYTGATIALPPSGRTVVTRQGVLSLVEVGFCQPIQH